MTQSVYLIYPFLFSVQGNGEARVLMTDQFINDANNGTFNGIEIVLSSYSLTIQDYASKNIYNFTNNVNIQYFLL